MTTPTDILLSIVITLCFSLVLVELGGWGWRPLPAFRSDWSGFGATRLSGAGGWRWDLPIAVAEIFACSCGEVLLCGSVWWQWWSSCCDNVGWGVCGAVPMTAGGNWVCIQGRKKEDMSEIIRRQSSCSKLHKLHSRELNWTTGWERTSVCAINPVWGPNFVPKKRPMEFHSHISFRGYESVTRWEDFQGVWWLNRCPTYFVTGNSLYTGVNHQWDRWPILSDSIPDSHLLAHTQMT